MPKFIVQTQIWKKLDSKTDLKAIKLSILVMNFQMRTLFFVGNNGSEFLLTTARVFMQF